MTANGRCGKVLAAALVIVGWAAAPDAALAQTTKQEHAKNIADCVGSVLEDPNVAIRGCTRIIKENRESEHNISLAHFNRGVALVGKGTRTNDHSDFDRAIYDFNIAIQKRPGVADFYMNRGLAFQYKKDFMQALSDYDAAIKIDPSLGFAYANRASVHYEIDLFDKSIADYNQALRLKPRWVSLYVGRGRVYYYLREFAKSIQDFDQAIKLEPNCTESLCHGRGALRIRDVSDSSNGRRRWTGSDRTKAVSVFRHFWTKLQA